jgi:hypothetical protein
MSLPDRVMASIVHGRGPGGALMGFKFSYLHHTAKVLTCT